jgi:hypothetical protein
MKIVVERIQKAQRLKGPVWIKHVSVSGSVVVGLWPLLLAGSEALRL